MIIDKTCHVNGFAPKEDGIIVVEDINTLDADVVKFNYDEEHVYTSDVYFSFDVDTANTSIYYTMDGSDPLCSPARKIYTEGSVILVKNTETRVIQVRAIARMGNTLSNEISFAINMEHRHPSKHDCHCRPHRPHDFICPPPEVNINKSLKLNISGIPEFMVENIVYDITVSVISGSGKFKCADCSDFILGLDDYKSEINVNEGDRITIPVMASACRSSDTGTILFRAVDDFSGESKNYSYSFSIVTEDAEHPYTGVRILWKKNCSAKMYNIYSKERCGDLNLVVSVPHDKSSGSEYQWYLDRNGKVSTCYTVAAVDNNGQEGECSLPRHAPGTFDNLCLVQGNLANLGAAPLKGVPIAYRIKDMTTIGSTMISKGTNLVYTDHRGYFEFEVPQNSIILLNIDDAGFHRSLVIPPYQNVDIEELLSLPQNRIN